MHSAPSTSVQCRPKLKAGEPVKPLAKTLIRSLCTGDFGQNLAHVEGLAHGPVLDGRQTLLFTSDKTINRNGQVSQFVVFSLDLR
jgi:hypothetical protein